MNTFDNDADADRKMGNRKNSIVLSDNAGKSYDCYFIQDTGTYKDLEDFYVNVYKGWNDRWSCICSFQEWNQFRGEYENKTTKSVQRGTADPKILEDYISQPI